jgi:hypothetical protein
MKKKRLSIGLIGIALALSLITFLFMGNFGAFAQSPVAPSTIKIGCVNSITGAGVLGGKFVQTGYDTGIKHINEAGGVYIRVSSSSSR